MTKHDPLKSFSVLNWDTLREDRLLNGDYSAAVL